MRSTEASGPPPRRQIRPVDGGNIAPELRAKMPYKAYHRVPRSIARSTSASADEQVQAAPGKNASSLDVMSDRT